MVLIFTRIQKKGLDIGKFIWRVYMMINLYNVTVYIQFNSREEQRYHEKLFQQLVNLTLDIKVNVPPNFEIMRNYLWRRSIKCRETLLISAENENKSNY